MFLHNKLLILCFDLRNIALINWEKVMKIKMICTAVLLSAAVVSQASAGGLLSGGKGGIGSGAIAVAPGISVLNGSNTSVLSGILSSNSILNGNAILSGNDGNSLLGLGILSGNNNDNSRNKNRR
jgi:hypothetical protein